MQLGTEETPQTPVTTLTPEPLLQTAPRKTAAPVEEYLGRVRAGLSGVSGERQEELLAQVMARIDLEIELNPAVEGDEWAVKELLARIGEPVELARQLRSTLPAAESAPSMAVGKLTSCRSCGKEVSWQAFTCPHCGAPRPAQQMWSGVGYEWKSKQTLFGFPLVHVAVGRDANGKLRVAKGIVAIGQFGIGAITIAQFGVGAIFGLGQFVIAPLAVGQFAAGLVAIGQFGLGVLGGVGMFATGLWHSRLFPRG